MSEILTVAIGDGAARQASLLFSYLNRVQPDNAFFSTNHYRKHARVLFVASSHPGRLCSPESEPEPEPENPLFASDYEGVLPWSDRVLSVPAGGFSATSGWNERFCLLEEKVRSQLEDCDLISGLQLLMDGGELHPEVTQGAVELLTQECPKLQFTIESQGSGEESMKLCRSALNLSLLNSELEGNAIFSVIDASDSVLNSSHHQKPNQWFSEFAAHARFSSVQHFKSAGIRNIIRHFNGHGSIVHDQFAALEMSTKGLISLSGHDETTEDVECSRRGIWMANTKEGIREWDSVNQPAPVINISRGLPIKVWKENKTGERPVTEILVRSIGLHADPDPYDVWNIGAHPKFGRWFNELGTVQKSSTWKGLGVEADCVCHSLEALTKLMGRRPNK